MVPLTSLCLKRPVEFAIYEHLNSQTTLSQRLGWESGPSYFLNGAIASSLGATLGCPFNIVKVKMQSTMGSTTSGSRGTTTGSGTSGTGTTTGTTGTATGLPAAGGTNAGSMNTKGSTTGSANTTSTSSTNDGFSKLKSAKAQETFKSTSSQQQGLRVRDVVRQIYQTQGILGFWRGLHLQYSFSVPAASIYLGLYGKFREALLIDKNDGFFVSQGVAGGVAGILASVVMWSVMIPVDVVRTKVQANEGFLSTKDAILDVYRSRGFFKGFFAGLSPMYFRAMALTAPSMFTYEYVRGFVATLKAKGYS